MLDEKSFTAVYIGQWLKEDLSSLFSEAQVLDKKDFIAFYIVSSQDDLDPDPYQDLRAIEAEPEPDEPVDLCQTEGDWPITKYTFGED